MRDTLVRSTVCLTLFLFLVSAQTGHAALAAHAGQAGQAAADTVTLVLGAPMDREIGPGQEHHYRLALPAGQFAGMTVDQHGIDVIVQLVGAEGKSIADFDAESRLEGSERVGLVGDDSGQADLVIKPKYAKAPAGHYDISVLETRAATDKDRSFFEAHKLYTAATVANDAGNYNDAQQLATRAATAAEAAEPNGAYLGYVLTGLANVERARGNNAAVEELFQRALTIDESALGREDPQTAFLLSSMAAHYINTDEFTKADPLIHEAIDITTKTVGPRNPRLITHLMNLALLQIYREDYERALPELQRALSIGEDMLDPDDFLVAIVVNNLSGIYIHLSDYDRAEPLAQRALQAFEKRFGPDNPRVNNTLANLAIIARQHKQFDRALELLHRAQDIRAKTMGPRHPDTATLSITIGNVHRFAGDYAAALEEYQKAYDVLEAVVGPNHSLTLLAVSNAASAYTAQGNIAKALEYQARSEQIQEKNIELNMALGTERERFVYVDAISNQTDRTISLHVRQAPDNQQAKELAALVLLQRKGRVLDAVTDSMTTLRQRMNADDQQLLDKLGATTRQLATLTLNGPGKLAAAEYHSQLAALETERESLESAISERSTAFRAQSQPVTLAAVRAAIPEDAALIEFFVYHPFNPKAASEDEGYEDPHYVVYVIRQQGDVRWAELGPTAIVDRAIAALRETLRDPMRNDVRDRAREVDRLVMARVRPLIGDASRLLLSPAGALNLIPFEALVDESGRYGVERFAMNYLTSGRDLLRMQVPRLSRSEPLIIADPVFGEPLMAQSQRQRPESTSASARTRRRSVTTAADLSSVYFAPLVATGQEARAIKRLFPEATLLTRQNATKAALEKIDAPAILHIATHGFFLEDVGQPDKPDQTNNSQTNNPLLRSGLALAGANLRKTGHDDGILTALEASSLNLWGTQLVTLSACETGSGDVKSGEGVYGLRRSIFLAGAESLVMSFWSVYDTITREMMTSYYEALKQGQGRGDALRHAQLTMLKHDAHKHPFYWASFIQAGDWTSLDVHKSPGH